jgi:hypothetical protein
VYCSHGMHHYFLINMGPTMANICQTLRFEVFTAVTMKNVVFWDVSPHASCRNRCFSGSYCLKLEVTRSSKCQFLQEPHGDTSQKMTFFICQTCHLHYKCCECIHFVMGIPYISYQFTYDSILYYATNVLTLVIASSIFMSNEILISASYGISRT